MNRSYFNYLLKSKRHTIFFVIIVFALVSSLAPINHRSTDSMAVTMAVLSVVAYVFAGVMPLMLFSFVHSRKACDSFFALPVKRSEISLSIVAFAAIAVAIPYLVCVSGVYLLGVLGIIRTEVTGLGVSVLGATTVFGVLTTIAFIGGLYLMANSVVDGIVVVGGYLFIPVLLYFASNVFINTTTIGIASNGFEGIMNISLPFTAIDTIITLLSGGMRVKGMLLRYLINMIAHLLIGIYLLNKHFIGRDSERAENISNYYLCYPFLLFIYSTVMTFMVSLMAGGMSSGDYVFLAILYLLIFVFYTVFTFVYRRKIIISPRSIIIFVLTVATTLVFSFAAYNSRGFGLTYSYPKDNTPVGYRYDSYNYNAGEDEIVSRLNMHDMNVCDYEIWFEHTVWDRDADKEFVDIMEKIRNGAIDHFYEKGNDYTGSSLQVFNTYSGLDPMYSNNNYYYNAPKLTLEELDIISKYCDIEINVYLYQNYVVEDDEPVAYDGEQWQSFTYEQFKEIIGD